MWFEDPPMLIQKLDWDNSVMITYHGEVRDREEHYISLDTKWSGKRTDLGYVDLIPGEKWIEYYYPGRWYNIFRIGDKEGKLKGFYCNIIKPVIIEKNVLKWIDLALDLWVRPDGSYLILDEDEFEAQEPSADERDEAMNAVTELKEMVKEKNGPFSEIE